MKIKLLSILAGVGMAMSNVQPALAQAQTEPIKFALCYDLSKVYAFAVPQVAQAARDYAQILNQKGGIEGHPVEILVQDHGNEPQRGIECYEKMKREGAITFDFFSTPVGRALLPPEKFHSTKKGERGYRRDNQKKENQSTTYHSQVEQRFVGMEVFQLLKPSLLGILTIHRLQNIL